MGKIQTIFSCVILNINYADTAHRDCARKISDLNTWLRKTKYINLSDGLTFKEWVLWRNLTVYHFLACFCLARNCPIWHDSTNKIFHIWICVSFQPRFGEESKWWFNKRICAGSWQSHLTLLFLFLKNTGASKADVNVMKEIEVKNNRAKRHIFSLAA